ncbi:IclR family transcriptional regulator [Parafrigoribacterium mesophilum]|uniref:IclR family transcriptional regulator n=1 Tax=Parafrigoribacterium mesophilum TaxID=433646 RepID=UPI0031FD5DB1
MTSRTVPHSQTLSRGIRVLELLSESREPMTIAELAAGLGVHRSIVYRIMRTLEDHRLVVRDHAGGVALGPRLAALAGGVSRNLQAAVLPELTALAGELGMTAFLVVLDRDECVTLVSVEPRHLNGSVAQRPGTRHHVSVGAPGMAIQCSLPDEDLALLLPHGHPRGEVGLARERGFAVSHGEVIAGVSSVSVPVTVHGQAPSAISVVYVTSNQPTEVIAERLKLAAKTVQANYA